MCDRMQAGLWCLVVAGCRCIKRVLQEVAVVWVLLSFGQGPWSEFTNHQSADRNSDTRRLVRKTECSLSYNMRAELSGVLDVN